MPRTIYKGPAGATLAQCRVEVCSLFVHRHEVTGAPKSRPWRLLWATGPDASTYVHAEGECSARYHRTMKDAIAYGLSAYGEAAARFPG
jgi:hypothetical protein